MKVYSYEQYFKNFMNYIFILLFMFATSPANASHPLQVEPGQAIEAIIGESGGEPFAGQVAVAETIRHRGSLKGVYGLKARHRQYTRLERDTATRAWELSATTHYSQGADGWGNANDIKIFKRAKWFRGCKIIKQIGNHYFWRII